VPDHFATLSLPHTPWLDPDLLKERFLRLSAAHHPDAGGSAEAFFHLNTAWQTLRDPGSCLRHYLELEHPDALPTASQTPGELGNLFMDIAAARQAAQQLTTRLTATTSPLARSLLEPERRTLLTRLESLTSQINTRLESAHSTLRTNPNLNPSELAILLSTLVFVGKWSTQLRESTLALT
jgi:hypothetical protein